MNGGACQTATTNSTGNAEARREKLRRELRLEQFNPQKFTTKNMQITLSN